MDQNHFLIGSVVVDTEPVKLVSKVRASVNKLIAQGVHIDNESPSYTFTKLNDMKPDML